MIKRKIAAVIICLGMWFVLSIPLLLGYVNWITITYSAGGLILAIFIFWQIKESGWNVPIFPCPRDN